MSGGHYDYIHHRIAEFADRLKGDLTVKNIAKLKNEYKFTGETIKNMKATEKLIRQAGDLAYAVEWLMSGDTGQDDFNKEFERVKKIWIIKIF